MATHFYTLQIKEIQKETADCVSILFDIPENLKDEFRYTQGQHLTVKTSLNSTEIRRNYSLCSSPLHNEWRIAVKKVDGGLFSEYANNQLKVGNTLDVMPPTGKFYTPLNKENIKNYIAFAAGSGITPLLSIITTTLITEPKSTFTLVYGNKNRSSIIFKEQLEALKNNYMQRFTLIHILSREKTDIELNSGRINMPKCELLFNKLLLLNNFDEFFICGPQLMIEEVSSFLKSKNVAKEKIHFELFTNTKRTDFKQTEKQNFEGKITEISILLDGVETNYLLPKTNESILDMALANGANLPFACKGGMCCTCKAKLEKGQVSMDVHYGLEDIEIEQGFILTCQAHAITDSVKINFDIK